MPRGSTALPSGGFRLVRSSPVPLYQQLYEQIRWHIDTGQFQPGSRLPATRTLAEELQVSRNTVLVAYERLLAEGYLDGKVGSGTRVAGSAPAGSISPEAARMPDAWEKKPRGAPRLSRAAQTVLKASREVDVPHETLAYPARPFTLGTPALDAFPTTTWSRIVSRRSYRMSSALYAHRDPAGYWPLRKEIASYLGLTRGVKCTADEVIIVSSSQAALNLLARMLLDEGEQVLVENPGFAGNRAALAAAGVEPCPVDMDSEGICVLLGESRYPQARMAVVTPNNQFPLSNRMSDFRRGQLLDWVERVDGWVVEDDYDGEFWVGQPCPPLQQRDLSGRVVYIGTFSKVFFPAMRMAYMVVPPELVDIVTAAQRFTVSSLPILIQAAMADFLVENHFARHVRRMREVYAERGEACVEALGKHFGDLVAVEPPAAGMHLTVWFPEGTDDLRMARLCRQQGVRIYPLSGFFAASGPGGPGGTAAGAPGAPGGA
ncbi:MocR-like pyridoxine biosynthesis transcription factor PdxR, partial [Kitasatospora sp. NPDC054939]